MIIILVMFEMAHPCQCSGHHGVESRRICLQVTSGGDLVDSDGTVQCQWPRLSVCLTGPETTPWCILLHTRPPTHTHPRSVMVRSSCGVNVSQSCLNQTGNITSHIDSKPVLICWISWGSNKKCGLTCNRRGYSCMTSFYSKLLRVPRGVPLHWCGPAVCPNW